MLLPLILALPITGAPSKLISCFFRLGLSCLLLRRFFPCIVSTIVCFFHVPYETRFTFLISWLCCHGLAVNSSFALICFNFPEILIFNKMYCQLFCHVSLFIRGGFIANLQKIRMLFSQTVTVVLALILPYYLYFTQ